MTLSVFLPTEGFGKSLNLSECVDGYSESIMRGVRCHESRLFGRDWLENDEQMGRDSARIDALQTVINCAVSPALPPGRQQECQRME